MIEVPVDGPLGEDHVGVLGGDELAKRFSGILVYHGGSVDLACKDRLRAQNLASGRALGRPNGGSLRMRLASDARLAAGEVDDRDAMAECGIARQGASTAGFGIVRMAAHTDDLRCPGGRPVRRPARRKAEKGLAGVIGLHHTRVYPG